ncbi:Ubiquitin-like superfamily protein [Euphorbia peplus]|nr:Ubiquitin-like superfamily protein [Euphorbia peplus]
MKVIIVAWGREYPLQVGSQEPVLEIKRKIELLFGVPVPAQTLSVFGWELVDGLDMEDYPIISESTKIDLTLQPMSPLFTRKIQVSVKFSSWQIYVEVDENDTVRSLKEKIHILHGTPIKRMSLFYSGKELDEDFRNLSEYGIIELSEIVVILKTMTRIRDSRSVSIVVQTASCLMNSARIPLEMKDSSTVNDMRRHLLTRKILPEDDYLFIHKQRIMRDNCSLGWHGVQNGDFLYVFKGTVCRNNSY